MALALRCCATVRSFASARRCSHTWRMSKLETPEFLKSKIDGFGGADAYNHYAVGWAHAMNTPYQWTKQIASHFGGTRNGTIVHWPKGIKAKGQVRSQFCHVIDIAPTVLEAAGIPAPAVVNGIQQAAYEGASMLYAATTPRPPNGARLSTSRCSATAASTTRDGRRSPGTAYPGPAHTSGRSTRMSGSYTTRTPTGRNQRIWRKRIRRNSRSAAPVPDRGHEVQRAATRRSQLRAIQRGTRGQAAAAQGQLAGAKARCSSRTTNPIQ